MLSMTVKPSAESCRPSDRAEGGQAGTGATSRAATWPVATMSAMRGSDPSAALQGSRASSSAAGSHRRGRDVEGATMGDLPGSVGSIPAQQTMRRKRSSSSAP
jgi:hypothetical protein